MNARIAEIVAELLAWRVGFAAFLAEHRAQPLPPPPSDQGNDCSFVEREAEREMASAGGGE